MLKTPEHMRSTAPAPEVLGGDAMAIMALIAGVRGKGPDVKHLEEGVIEIGHFSLDMLIWGRNAPKFYMGWPAMRPMPEGSTLKELHSYGVCDTPKQFLDRYREILAKDERTFVLSFTHIPKPAERETGGWRWHKWGPYIGDGTPTTEYLAFEPEFADGVYVFHICQTDGPAMTLDYKTGEFRKLAEGEDD